MNTDLVKKVRNNSWLFLRRAIKELISHDDSNDDGLSEERAIMATTLMQMSFELSLVAYFIELDGIRGIVKGENTSLTEDELFLKFEQNELYTKTFNSLKKIALEKNIFLNSDDEFFINDFQQIRNKLVHLNYAFDESELYDLKYDLIHFVINVIIPTLSNEEVKFSEVISMNLDKKDFLKLINFPPYAYAMHKVAQENAKNVYRCVHCGNDSLAIEVGEEHCYSCGEDLSHAGFIDCPYCKSERSMIYDALNIGNQKDRTMRGLCLKCENDDLVYLCEKCDSEVALEGNAGANKCHPGFCQWGEE